MILDQEQTGKERKWSFDLTMQVADYVLVIMYRSKEHCMNQGQSSTNGQYRINIILYMNEGYIPER